MMITQYQLKISLWVLIMLYVAPMTKPVITIGFFIGVALCGVYGFYYNKWNMVGIDWHVIELLSGSDEGKYPIKYRYPFGADVSKLMELKGSGYIALCRFVILFVVKLGLIWPPGIWIMYLLAIPLITDSMNLRRLCWPKNRVVSVWYSDKPSELGLLDSLNAEAQPYGYIVWDIPRLAWHRVKQHSSCTLVRCEREDNKHNIISVLTDGDASLYLVNGHEVIPMCYNRKDNEAAIDNICEAFKDVDIRVVSIADNPFSTSYTLRRLVLLYITQSICIFMVLRYIYSSLHCNIEVASISSPLVSMMLAWVIMEFRLWLLHRHGAAKMRQAAGLS